MILVASVIEVFIKTLSAKLFHQANSTNAESLMKCGRQSFSTHW